MSLTPAHRNAEATNEAMQEGMIAGGLVLAPASAAVYIALQRSPGFVKATNWQSRTALAIMPALFSFAWTAERHLDHKMEEIATESRHAQDTVKWADDHARTLGHGQIDKEIHLMDLYRRSIDESGVNVVPGDKLGLQHRFANYVLANPVKVLAGLAVPSVALIFYGKSGQEHLQASVKLLHTRVFGQFTTLSLMLGIMGFHQYMASNGKYITEVEANRRVEEMTEIREALLARLDYEAEKKEQQQQKFKEMRLKKKAAKEQEAVATSTVAPTALATSAKE